MSLAVFHLKQHYAEIDILGDLVPPTEQKQAIWDRDTIHPITRHLTINMILKLLF